jgi:NAD(P)-dependent dehydrogenase (short-subunit alcohol dehydrogenase family)
MFRSLDASGVAEAGHFTRKGNPMVSPVVLITGALAGIGHETSIAFAEQGARLVISGRRSEAGKDLARKLRELGAEVEFVRADVQFEADVAALMAATIMRFGRLDVAVNNAGTEGVLGPIVEQTKENFHDTFNTNVLGTLFSMKYELPIMLAQGGGSIINMSSMGGHVGLANTSVYTASKHAVEGLTKCAALEGAAIGVRVNAIAAGPVETEMLQRFVGGSDAAKSSVLGMVPARRAARPREIAELVLFMASDKSPYMTGSSVRIDGGYTAQ